MTRKIIHVALNGVTGRMGTNQHLVRSLLAIRDQGGCRLSDGTLVLPDPILVGRNRDKTEQLAKRHAIERWTCDLDRALEAAGDGTEASVEAVNSLHLVTAIL